MQATQKVLITAGASGIGRAMALRFARQGAKVFVVDIDAPALRALAQEQPGILTSVCDIGERNAVESVIPEAIEALGGLDVLINNAGIAGPTAPLADFDPGAWEQVMNVNPQRHLQRHAHVNIPSAQEPTMANKTAAPKRKP